MYPQFGKNNGSISNSNAIQQNSFYLTATSPPLNVTTIKSSDGGGVTEFSVALANEIVLPEDEAWHVALTSITKLPLPQAVREKKENINNNTKKYTMRIGSEK